MQDEVGTRFFARVRAFDLACPRCDAIFVVTSSSAGRRGRARTSNSCWDPRLGKFRCYYCGLRLTLGIIAYSMEKGRQSPAEDQVPTPRQAQAMRDAFPSVWAAARLKSGGARGKRKAAKTRVNRIVGEIPIIGDDVDLSTLPDTLPE